MMGHWTYGKSPTQIRQEVWDGWLNVKGWGGKWYSLHQQLTHHLNGTELPKEPVWDMWNEMVLVAKEVLDERCSDHTA